MKKANDHGKSKISEPSLSTREEKIAFLTLEPATGAATTVKSFALGDSMESIGGALTCELSRLIKDVASDDDMERAQKLLAAQAMTLDAIFHRFAKQALSSSLLSHLETYMSLALKAQAQSRCTLEAISKIKNPPNATFVKQANITQGNQQVNNYGNPVTELAAPPRTQEIQNPPNELLEAPHDERMDFGTQAAPEAINPEMETLAAVDRPKNRKRKTKSQP